ncbi:MAG: polyphosphate kinase 1, partial [Saprospiraceae bacterium]|nr:polyphosphate kinase 1 [Saprospiraceae bacterium]
MPTALYFSRDLSWLSFNHRVLQEACDPRVPLYEKIKFLAIYSANLDEFYRVRVSALRSFKSLKKETRREFELKPKKELRQIRAIVEEQQREFGSIFRELIIPELERNGIRLLKTEEFSETQSAFAAQYFKEQVLAHIQPQVLLEGDEAPFLKNKALYFVVVTAEAPAGLYLVEMPVGPCPRFVELPG